MGLETGVLSDGEFLSVDDSALVCLDLGTTQLTNVHFSLRSSFEVRVFICAGDNGLTCLILCLNAEETGSHIGRHGGSFS